MCSCPGPDTKRPCIRSSAARDGYDQLAQALARRRPDLGDRHPQQPGTCGGCPPGPIPETTRGRRAWRQAAAAIEDYRRSYQITDPNQALGPVPREPAQRAAWRHARTTAQRVQERQRTAHREERIATALPGALDRSQRDHAHAAQQRAEAPGGPAWCWPPARPPGCWPPYLRLG